MYIADLHIHSRYSRATSKDCTPEYLDLWARRKGIGVLGTGDFTHPAWREELKEKLIPAEDGFYVLKDEYRLEKGVYDGEAPRFVVSGEISSIYKKNGRVRKVHSLILLPGLEEAELLARRLETIGNLHSDGRPILGLDCHDLLEITLELCLRAIFIPAHIWTPHFSLFGACSGFDTIEECFEDLTPYIHALETGLSSDPPMIWRLSALDLFQLVSNSDAHSPAKLGREANLLDTERSYLGLSRAIQKGEGLLGTIEFFPEEGKYHYDGHRKCHLCLTPQEAEGYSGKCPVCGRKLTMGVLHRIEQLADREEGFVLPGGKPFESLVPLPEVIAVSTGASAAGAKVQKQYEAMLRDLGSEFRILRELPIEDLRHHSGYLISEGIRRLREGRVERTPGFDGEYGRIRLFDQLELDSLDGQLSLFTGEELKALKAAPKAEGALPKIEKGSQTPDKAEISLQSGEVLFENLNEEQQAAVTALSRAVVVIAGPGTGKTRTLVLRIVYLLTKRMVRASEITAVTFTRKAAEEMRGRLEMAAGGKRAISRMKIGTFHSICWEILKKQGLPYALAEEAELLDLAEEILERHGQKESPRQFLRLVSLKKTGLEQSLSKDALTPELQEAIADYEERLLKEGLLDYDDLLLKMLELLKKEKKNEIRKQSFSYLLVDEFQDLSPLQYQLLQAWNQGGRELFVIGDPDQAIYSFRGADGACFERLRKEVPELLTIRLHRNYRSGPQIIKGALSVMNENPGQERRLTPLKREGVPIRVVTATGEKAEAIFAAKEINRLIGGIDMLDMENPSSDRERVRSFGEIAILYRTHRQAELLEACLKKEGIPYVVTGREEFLSEKLVRGAICFFKYLVNQENLTARRLCLKLLWNLPEEGIEEEGPASMVEKYLPKIKREKPQKLLAAWMLDMGLEGEESLEKLASMAVFYKTMPEFLDVLAFGLESDLKRCGGRTYTADAVTLMTLHGAKGLEFPVVLIYGVRKGNIPLEREKEKGNQEEERRLFYVGMTRAREELILLTSPEPSVFLEDLPDEVIVREQTGKSRINGGGRQLSLFEFM